MLLLQICFASLSDISDACRLSRSNVSYSTLKYFFQAIDGTILLPNWRVHINQTILKCYITRNVKQDVEILIKHRLQL